MQGESTPTAWCHVGIRSPQRCTSFAVGKGEYREGGPGQNFRQEIYAGRIHTNCLASRRGLKLFSQNNLYLYRIATPQIVHRLHQVFPLS